MSFHSLQASKGVMSCVTQEVKDIHYLLEHEFLPSDLAQKVLPLLTKISKLGGKLSTASSIPEVHLSQYVPALEKLATLRLLQQVCFQFTPFYWHVHVCFFFCLNVLLYVNLFPLFLPGF